MGVNAFNFSWEKENNCLVPPLSDIPKVISKVREEVVEGTMIVPYWPSASFWPLLKKGDIWEPFVQDSMIFENGKWFIQQGSCAFSLLGSMKFTGAIMALKIKS